MELSRANRLVLLIGVMLVLGACANHRLAIMGGGSAPLHVRDTFTPAALQPIDSRRPINVVVHAYEDGRPEAPSRRIGEIRDTFVSDMTGSEIEIDEDIPTLVTEAMGKQLAAAGYHVVDAGRDGGPAATFVIAGRITKFSLDVLSRDKVDIEVQSRVTDPRSNEVIWSGTVKEQTERFAGVVGDSRSSLVSYLDDSLRHVTEKTVKTLTANLVQSLPDMFLQAGAPTPGVSVQTAPHVHNEDHAQPAPNVADKDGGELSITTAPAGVQVYIGDVYYGASPLTLKLAAGIYAVRLAADGYREVTQKVSVRAAQTTRWRVEMRR